MKSKIVAGVTAGLLAMGVLAGCSQQAEEPQEPSTSSSSEVVEETKVLTIGEKSDGGVVLEVSNETGKDVVEVYAKSSADEAYPEEKLACEGPWEDGATAELCLPPADAAAADSAAEGAADVVLSATYDVMLVFDDGTSAELFEVTEGDYRDLAVQLEGEVAYLTYEDAATGASESTLQHQQSVIDARAAEAEAAAQAEAEAAAAAEAAQAESQSVPQEDQSAQYAGGAGASDAGSYGSGSADSGSTDYGYSYDTSTPSDGGFGAQGGGSGQSEDACVSDLVLR